MPNISFPILRQTGYPFYDFDEDQRCENTQKEDNCAVEDQLDGKMDKLGIFIGTYEDSLRIYYFFYIVIYFLFLSR